MGDDTLETGESMEVQSDTETDTASDDVGVGSAGEPVAQSEDLLEHLPEVPAETASGSPEADAEVPASLSPDRVEELVEAVLSSDRVTGLLDSFEYTLSSMADMVAASAASAEEREEREELEPIVVVKADELLDRLEARQAETAEAAQEAAQASVKSSLMGGQTVVASSSAAVRGGEILVPESGEVAVIDVIAELVQAIYDHFTEDDSDNLSGIRQTLTEIKESVEPHPLMDTPFEDYTVTEGLLLVAVLWFIVVSPCIKMLKGGFSWLN